MSTQQNVKADERTIAVTLAANNWGLNFMTFALLIDIMYRSVVYHEQCWDLFALLFLGGGIAIVYRARHKALGHLFGWKMVVLLALTALVAAVVAFILARTNAM
ncbi:MAG: hypothetical protein ACYC4N_12630 [Pirellulaceae bacterium]